MFLGTASDVGKSLLVAGVGRALHRRGLRVRPFKAQNMSNNAAVTPGGGEIGRAQATQARACGIAPTVHMNPVLLKPEGERGSQLIVRGEVRGHAGSSLFRGERAGLLDAVLESFAIVSEDADIVLVEGAGSPAELNLRAGDIANLGFARAADVPALLIGDIERGGVLASLVGTLVLLQESDPADAELVRAFVVNRFRGDPALFEDGVRYLEARTQRLCLGVVPWVPEAEYLPREDSVGYGVAATRPGDGRLRVVVPALPRASNLDDLDPLRAEADIELCVVPPGEALPGDATLILLTGSKSTLADLRFLKAQGWHHDLLAHHRRGGAVLGLCGGYQMLGRWVRDPQGIEGPAGEERGLGLLDVETVLGPRKQLGQVEGRHADTGAPLRGYEIHLGETTGPDCLRPWLQLGDRSDGACSADGSVRGCYVHGVMASDAFRAEYLASLAGREISQSRYELQLERALDRLGEVVAQSLDLDRLLEIAA